MGAQMPRKGATRDRRGRLCGSLGQPLPDRTRAHHDRGHQRMHQHGARRLGDVAGRGLREARAGRPTIRPGGHPRGGPVGEKLAGSLQDHLGGAPRHPVHLGVVGIRRRDRARQHGAGVQDQPDGRAIRLPDRARPASEPLRLVDRPHPRSGWGPKSGLQTLALHRDQPGPPHDATGYGTGRHLRSVGADGGHLNQVAAPRVVIVEDLADLLGMDGATDDVEVDVAVDRAREDTVEEVVHDDRLHV